MKPMEIKKLQSVLEIRETDAISLSLINENETTNSSR